LRYINRGTRQQLNGLQRSIDMLLPWLTSFQKVPAQFDEESLTPDLAKAWHALKAAFPEQPILSDISAVCQSGSQASIQLREILQSQNDPAWGEASQWLSELEEKLEAGMLAAEGLIAGYQDLALRCDMLVEGMDFAFLYDPERQVFHLGYNVTTGSLDMNYYDLLASEARLANLVAIAKGEVPQSHCCCSVDLLPA
jgi:cyclic beta-1,2-glucan synthetase